jgi:hypothetical protein
MVKSDHINIFGAVKIGEEITLELKSVTRYASDWEPKVNTVILYRKTADARGLTVHLNHKMELMSITRNNKTGQLIITHPKKRPYRPQAQVKCAHASVCKIKSCFHYKPHNRRKTCAPTICPMGARPHTQCVAIKPRRPQ